MRVLYKEYPRTIAIQSGSISLCFRQVKLKSKSNNKKAGSAVAVEIIPNDQISQENGYRTLVNREVSGCLGLINVDQQIFLAVITGAISNIASPVNYETVDKIYSVDFVSLTTNEWDFANLDANGYPMDTVEASTDDYEYRQAHPCHELKKLLSNGSFYYSNDFDLTSLLQNRGLDNSKLNGSASPNSASKKAINLDHYQQEYMWNSFMMDELIKLRSNLDEFSQSLLNESGILTTVIRGFAKTVTFASSGAAITIISKQSWKRAGTRFNARGIDDNGNVANYVETEFIYDNPSQNLIFSFTQIRGSVPTFWEQESTLVNPKISLTRSLEATQPIFNKHFDEVCSKYGVCHIVNLLSRTKPAEVQVLRRYKDLYQHSTHFDDIAFSDFDFHHETKAAAGGFSGATKILPLLYDSLERFGWFTYDTEQAEVITRQDGVFRVNCLDCLDRTNLIQQVICQSVVEHIVKNYLQANGGPDASSYRERLVFDEIAHKHNALWADNGDAISQIYTGTNALKSSFSRSGKMNFAGALSDVTKSVSRMYQNTFMDSKKQSTMDLMLGYDAQFSTPVKIYDPINEYVHDKLKQSSSTFTTHDNINIFVGTFNVNAASPLNKNMELTNWLFPPENLDHGLPDIFAIGLQELIELNAGSILSADNSKGSQWAGILESQLNSQNEPYLLLRTEAIASMSLFLFVKKSQVHHVTQVAGSSKKTGMGGITANKGACAVRFEFGNTSFALVTSHLAAGVNAIVERYNDYRTIIDGLTFTRNYTIKDHDNIIWFGDLNYRINLQNDQCRYLIENGAFDELFRMDQLLIELQEPKDGAFFGFNEGKIKFYPTYKYDKGTSNYDTSEKQRVPSWTDRILYLPNQEDRKDALVQLNYNSVMDIYVSDHKPVYSTFNSQVKFVDEEKKLKLAKELYRSYKKEHSAEGDVVSLIEFESASSAPSKKASNSSFSADTLSEMNLLDDQTPAPRLPSRPATSNFNHPRRIPPPPLSRKAVTAVSNNGSMPAAAPRKLPPQPSSSSNTPPVPPPARKVSTTSPKPLSPDSTSSSSTSATSASVSQPKAQPYKPMKAPIGFSSTPLIPSASNSPSSTPNASSSSLPIQNNNGPKKPLVPTKPSALSGKKTGEPSDLSLNDSDKNRPPPPPPRSSSNTPVHAAKTMSDWKPLVPQ